MSLKLRFVLLLATACSPLAVAQAADYDPPVIVDQAAEYVPVEVGSGWYLRGDVGYAFSSEIGGVDYRTFDGATYGSSTFATAELDKNITWGGGVGYRFTDWVRADATIDGFRADFNGTTVSSAPCSTDPSFAGTTCRSEDGSEVSAVSLMANGYVDLGTYVGLTPYLGAGLGYTYLSWSGLTDTNYCVSGAVACAAGPVSSSSHAGLEDWRFTYALMAGVAYDVTPNLKIDLGYKYRNIEGGDMFAFDAGTAGIGATGIQGTHGDIEQHEVKVGLRYELW